MLKQYYKPETYQCRQSVAYLVRRARNLITAHVEDLFRRKFARQGITFQHWVILMCLRDDLARTPSEISQYLCYDSGALTRVIDQMEKRGLVKRDRSTEDRRVIELTLTAGGRKTLESLIPIVVEFYNELLADFSHDEADTLVRLLSKFVGTLSELPRPGD
jgi:DNA-binding MarR family transcriptional regulator